MSSSIPADHIRLLRQFVSICDAKPDMIHAPELEFFRQWLTKFVIFHPQICINKQDEISINSYRLGATLPPVTTHHSSEPEEHTHKTDNDSKTSSKPPEEPPKAESEPESDLGNLILIFFKFIY